MKYTSPSYELVEVKSEDVITASLADNGQGSITVGDRTIEGKEGTFSALFDELFGN